MFDAVLFDCDGVLVDSEILALDVGLAELGRIGLRYNRDVFIERFLGVDAARLRIEFDLDHQAQFGAPLPRGFFEAQKARLHQSYSERLQAVPSAREAVLACGVFKAVASSSRTVAVQRKLKLVGLHDLFGDRVVGGDQAPRPKPAPDIHLMAAALLDASPERTVAIEDSATGVAAAAAAGMQVWGFLGGAHVIASTAGRLRAAGATRLVADWPAAIALFEDRDKRGASR